MPYDRHWEANEGLHKRFHGTLSAADVIKSSIELHRDPRFDSLRYSINDFSDVTGTLGGLDASSLDDLAAASIGASMSKPNLRVLVVTQNATIAELARRYLDATGGAWPTEFFPTLEAARVWLAQPENFEVRNLTKRRLV